MVVTEAAVTAAEKVVVPVEVSASAPKAPLDPPPTTPVKVTLPEPEVMVRPYAWLAVLLSVLANATVPLLVVAKVMLAAKVAASP